MKELNEFVDGQNIFKNLFGKPKLDLKNQKDRLSIMGSLGCELSPENLHCDGEISPYEAQKKYNRLMKAVSQLKKLDPSLPDPMY